ncbi:hypothetical protein DdX_22325 [Ditylenchus destructor]|uniref:Uncharacterized protein n=1 Tax=Ditylenchus destructor TaxID=166010 RepID=A0AAD4MDR0_9BILA|nr:hypothetical protein DdX_22325 [Ditylenchus destructor]
MLQAYINEVFEKINGLFARTDFNGVRLRYVPSVMTLDNFCASKQSSMLCSDDFILDTSQAVIEISAIPEIKRQQTPCLILFLASKSTRPTVTRSHRRDSFLEMLAQQNTATFNKTAEQLRTYALIPSASECSLKI